MNKRDELSRLKEFSEEVEKIRNRGFSKYIKNSGKLGYSFEFTPETMTVSYAGPTEDETISFVMSCRYFLQLKERFYIGSIISGIRFIGKNSKEIDQKISTWEDNYREFCNASSTVQNFRHITKAKLMLTSKDLFDLASDAGKRCTKLELLERVIYGEIAHKDKEKQSILRDQLNDPISKDAHNAEFQLCLFEFWHQIESLEEIASRLLSTVKD